MHVYMSSKNVAIQRTVYDALSREKRQGESFTSLFRRLLDQREGIEEVMGLWGPARARLDRALLRQLRGGAPRRR